MDFTYDITMFKDVFESSFTWLSGFERNVRRYNDKAAISDPEYDKSLTYEQLNTVCNKFANSLKADGVGRHDVILYQIKNSFDFAYCYIAPQKIGAINSPANFKLAPGEIAKIMEHNTPKVYVYEYAIKDVAAKAIEISKHKPEVILVAEYHDKDKPELPKGHILLSEYIEKGSEETPQNDFKPHIYDEVTRMYTSGTTSLPKGVPVNNINEVLSAHDVIMHFPLSITDKTMNTTPWFHRGGLHSGGLAPTLYVGAESVVLRNFNPKTCLEYTEKFGVTFIIGAPAVLEMLAKRQELSLFDLSGLRGIVTMGSPLEKAACIRYRNILTPNIFNGYGTTETFWNTFLRPFDLPKMAGSAGRSCTDDEVRVVNIYEDRKAEPDDVVPQDGKTVGEVIIMTPSKSTYAYYNNEEMTKQKFYKGWMYTSDLGTWNDKSYVTIAGRKDDMIISSGENIYPTQIEEALNENPKVKDSMVTSVPDRVRGEVLVAYVVKADESLEVSELKEFCNNHPDLPSFKRPRYYRFVDEMPMTATGKKQHYKVKEMAKKDLEDGLLTKK